MQTWRSNTTGKLMAYTYYNSASAVPDAYMSHTRYWDKSQVWGRLAGQTCMTDAHVGLRFWKPQCSPCLLQQLISSRCLIQQSFSKPCLLTAMHQLQAQATPKQVRTSNERIQ